MSEAFVPASFPEGSYWHVKDSKKHLSSNKARFAKNLAGDQVADKNGGSASELLEVADGRSVENFDA